MKKIGTYTARGNIATESASPAKIILFDGSFKTGYRVVSFAVAGQGMGDANSDVIAAKLTTNATPGAQGPDWHWEDNSEIAWAFFQYELPGSGEPQSNYEKVDPDNMVVEDLYIWTNTRSEGHINYMIELEKYEITDWQGALGMVRNKSQG